MKTLDDYIEEELKPRDIKLWGDTIVRDFVPEFSLNSEGDAKQLVYFGTLNQRPRYWLMLIDSKHDVEDEDFNVEKVIIEYLEEEFGTTEEFIEEEDFEPGDYDTYEEYLEQTEYPRVDASYGYHWGSIVNISKKNEL